MFACFVALVGFDLSWSEAVGALWHVGVVAWFHGYMVFWYHVSWVKLCMLYGEGLYGEG